MLVVGFPSGPLQANCYLLAGGPDGPCVVVDPGQDVAAPLEARLAEHRLTPAAVLLTHGHFDHAYSATEVAETHDIPVWAHPGDRPLLSEPLRGVGSELARLLGPELAMREPEQLCDLTDGQALDLAGLRITVLHTPGHTEGSVCFHVVIAPLTRQPRSDPSRPNGPACCWRATRSSPGPSGGQTSPAAING